ncbi:hypothetical protein [Pontibacter rugosus]|uniref:Uncharacterized protein n=1 Tax=Pontibacter rugosus TaxID=1745966 RepID=A0ABW3SNC7_9BACT
MKKVLQNEIKLLTLHPAKERTAPKGIKSDTSEDGKRGKMFFYKFFERLLETEITEKGKSLPRFSAGEGGPGSDRHISTLG